MVVKELKKLLDGFSDDQKVVGFRESRMGHDDAVMGFDIGNGFLDPKNRSDLRLKETKRYNVPCCVICF